MPHVANEASTKRLQAPDQRVVSSSSISGEITDRVLQTTRFRLLLCRRGRKLGFSEEKSIPEIEEFTISRIFSNSLVLAIRSTKFCAFRRLGHQALGAIGIERIHDSSTYPEGTETTEATQRQIIRQRKAALMLRFRM